MLDSGSKIRGGLALAAGLLVAGSLPQAAGNDLPPATSQQPARRGGAGRAVGRAAGRHLQPPRLQVLRDCQARLPEAAGHQPRYRDRLLVRQINQDSDRPLVDFRGETITHARFAAAEKIKLVPAVAFYGPNGQRLVEPIVGARLPDFYTSYLETDIEQSTAALKAKSPAH